MSHVNFSGILRCKLNQILVKKARSIDNYIVDFAIPTDQRVKIKENEKRDKYLDFDTELKKNLWNMRVMAILIVIDVLGTVHKSLIIMIINETYKYLGILEADTIKQVENKWKNYSRQNSLAETLSKE